MTKRRVQRTQNELTNQTNEKKMHLERKGGLVESHTYQISFVEPCKKNGTKEISWPPFDIEKSGILSLYLKSFDFHCKILVENEKKTKKKNN